MSFFRRHVVVAIPLALALVVGCGDDTGGGGNHAPNIVSLSVDPKYPAPGETATIRLSVIDVDNDPVRISWDTSGGNVTIDEGRSVWHVPLEVGTFKITCIASDGVDSHSKSINVRTWTPRPGNYYPLAVGNQWIFVDENENTITMSLIDTIPIEHTDITSYVLQTVTTDPGVPEGVSNYAYIGRIENGIDQHGLNVVFGSAETMVFDPWLPLYRFPLIPGESWETKYEGFTTDGFYIGEGKASYRVVDETTLDTPAGTFEHVFQVEETFEWKILNQEVDTTISRKWLAPDIGIVMIDQEQARGRQEAEHIIAKLVEYTVLPDTSFDLIPQPEVAASPFRDLR